MKENISESDFDLISKYFEHKLAGNEISDEDLKEFNEKFENNYAFAKAVKETIDFTVAVRLSDQKAKKDAPPKKSGKVRVFPMLTAIAAAAILLFITLYFLFLRPQINTQNTGPEVFAEYFNNLPSFPSTSRGSIDHNIDSMRIVNDIEGAYKNGEYAKAISLIETFPNDSLRNRWMIFVGVMRLEQGEHQAAQAIFQKIIDEHDYYEYHAHWFLGLSLFYEEKREEAKYHFQEVINTPIDYKEVERASAILEKYYNE